MYITEVSRLGNDGIIYSASFILYSLQKINKLKAIIKSVASSHDINNSFAETIMLLKIGHTPVIIVQYYSHEA